MCPGGVLTPLIRSFTAPPGADIELLRRVNIVPRLTEPEEVAESIAFLASPRARSMTGIALPMDNGVAAG